MNAQAQKVYNAIEKMHRLYSDGIKRYLDKVDHCSDTVTITITTTELDMLKLFVSNRIGDRHNDWYEATHDEMIDENDLAYNLAQIETQEQQLHRLYAKLKV